MRWFAICKRTGGKFYVTQTPEPKRNLQPRREAAASLRAQLKSIQAQLESQMSENEDAEPADVDLARLAKILEDKRKTLPEDSIEYIKNCAEAIQAPQEDESAEPETIAELLLQLVEHETREHPEKAARNILWNRRPRLLLFDDADRLLQSEYNLHEFLREKPRWGVPKALQNLANVSGLDLEAVLHAQETGDEGKIETLLDEANQELKRLVEQSWSQSDITVRLRLNQTILHVVVKETGGEFVRIAERSDGLRQFVALVVFLSETPDLNVAPVLLIDEAERHLHYDAQADLVQMLARQNVASKVVYTTHSIGCLPEDLGSGVRLVEAVDQHSRIINWFWDDDRPGFSRLLFGMGANTLAFIPVRYSVIAEGASDLLLLPALLKEVTGRDHLGFQVVPGLASATRDQVAVIDHQSPRTVYLTDGDRSSTALARKIRDAGVEEDRIFCLPHIGGQGTVIEDFVELESYVHAVNEELSRSHGSSFSIDQSAFSRTNRPLALKQWCQDNGIQAPNKRSAAYRLLDHRHEHRLAAADTKNQLIELYGELTKKLGVS